MTAQDFLKKTLSNWNNLFKGIIIKYAYDAVTEYHIIEIEPESIRRGNSDYKKAEMNLWIEFMEQFPDENLLITKPSEANDMSNIVYKNTLEYFKIMASWDINDCLNIHNDYQIFGYSFEQSKDTNISTIENEYALAA